jgi:hypothetical protein
LFVRFVAEAVFIRTDEGQVVERTSASVCCFYSASVAAAENAFITEIACIAGVCIAGVLISSYFKIVHLDRGTLSGVAIHSCTPLRVSTEAIFMSKIHFFTQSLSP